MLKEVAEKIDAKKAKIGVIGLGYVGLPLAIEFAKVGFHVLGFELSKKKISSINVGESYIPDVKSKEIKPLILEKRLRATSDTSLLKSCDCIIVCVPTPLNKVKEPDISFVLSAVEMIHANIRRGQLIILESTTYPGTTEEVLAPKLSQDGRKAGSDFFLCFSPERIDPGNQRFPVSAIPKVVGGITPSCTKLGAALYRQIVGHVIEVSSPRVAEFTKLLENTFRIVNIGLINELAVVSHDLEIDIWEAIEAAKTKPFGFMPFYPGPGIGGHCIGIDPLYLSWKAKLAGQEIRFVELASRVNAGMPDYVVKRIAYALNERGKTISRSKFLILGVSYKRDIDDIRESPALEVIETLQSLGGDVQYHDPFVPELEVASGCLKSVKLKEAIIKQCDAVVIVTDHTSVNYDVVVEKAGLILDTRNALRKFGKQEKILVL